MPKKILTFFNREFNGINEAALLLGGFAFISQLLGLIRDRTLANIVGPGPILDVYYAAFRIPDFLYISVASLASITVLMPFIVERMNTGNKDEAKKFLSNIFSVFLMFMIGISAIMIFLMPYIVRYIAPGFTESQIESLIITSRIMLLSPIFIGLSNLLGTITQLFKNFLIFSLSPIFYNLGILSGIIFLYPKFGVYGLALGVIIGAFLHLMVQIPVIISHGFLPKFVNKINWKEIYSVMKLSLPRTVTLSCNSFAFIFLIAMASTLLPGSISLFTFSYNLQSVPVGIIGISFSVAAFPILVKSFSSKDMDKFINNILSTAKQIVFWSLPVIALLIVLRAQIVRVILGTGTFSWTDTRLTAASVALFVISLVSQGLVLLLVRGYYASGNTKKPLMINVFSSLLVIILAYVFINVFKLYPTILIFIENMLRVRGVPGSIMLALPLAYALGSIINFFLLWFSFRKNFLKGVKSKLLVTFAQSFAAALILGIMAYASLGITSNLFSTNHGWGVFAEGFISGIIGIISGVFVLILLKNQELQDIITAFSHKFFKTRVVVPEQGEL